MSNPPRQKIVALCKNCDRHIYEGQQCVKGLMSGFYFCNDYCVDQFNAKRDIELKYEKVKS